MPLLKRRRTLLDKALRGVAALSIAVPGYLMFANYMAHQVDLEFQQSFDSVRFDDERKRAAIREDTDDAVGAKARRRLNESIVRDSSGNLPQVMDRNVQWTIPRGQTPAQAFDEVTNKLKTGDIVLFYGTGSMSWRISRLGYLFSAFNTDALRYSHVAMVAAPLPIDALDALQRVKQRHALVPRQPDAPWYKRLIGSNRTPTQMATSPTPMLDALVAASSPTSPLIIEAIDNKDCNARNVLPKPNSVVYDQVMVSYLRDRAFGVEYEPKPRWCYNRVAVRRLEGHTWDENTIVSYEAFLQNNCGRPMDKSPTLALAMVDPKLHKRASPAIISCSELVADGLRAIKVLPEVPLENWREAGGGKFLPSVMYAPLHFTTLGANWMGWSYLKEFTSERIRVRPEERIDMSITAGPTPPRPRGVPADLVTGTGGAEK
jgi:hypothetical protein